MTDTRAKELLVKSGELAKRCNGAAEQLAAWGDICASLLEESARRVQHSRAVIVRAEAVKARARALLEAGKG